MLRAMKTAVAAWVGAVALCLTLVSMAGAQAPASPAAQPAAPAEPAPIPLAEVAMRAEEVGAFVRSLEVQLAPDTRIVSIEAHLPPLRERLTVRFERTGLAIESQAGLGTLNALADSWHSSRAEVGTWLEILTSRGVWLTQQLQKLAALDKTWRRTREEYATRAPAYVMERIDAIQRALATAEDRVKDQGRATLELQDRIAREATRCDEALALLARARQQATSNLFVRESKPIWSAEVRRGVLAKLPELIRGSLDAQAVLLRQFVVDHIERMILHGGLIIALVALFWWARRRATDWRTRNRPAGALAPVFRQPVAAALLFGLLSGVWFYSDEPSSALILVQIATLLPVVVVLHGLLPPAVIPGLYGLAAFFLADSLRDFASIMPLVERGLFLVEMLAATVLVGWVLWSGRARSLLASDDGSMLGRARMLLAGLTFAGFVIAFVAGAIGSMNLARLIGSGILTSGYIALVLTAARRLAEGLFALALRVRPLRLLRMVDHHTETFERRAHVALQVLAIATWAFATLDIFGLFRPVLAGGHRILTAELAYGALRISLGDVLAFAATLYGASLFSRAIRFALEEDVFPRLRLSAGLPYALTSVLKYSVIFVGFVLGLLALGVNLDRVTILGGAFGIGVGFGLQNIVNNFVSGLIVLFERPVRVGDAVQIGDVQGQVRRIGIRSSTVRTWEGAEVIVPNSQLVSDKVTNWTPADQWRRLDLPVSVAYGTAPDKVLKVLSEVAHAHPDVAANPVPQPLFLGFGDSALLFTLQVWTARTDRHVAVKSELGIAIYAALREAGMTIPFPQQEIRVHQEPPPR